MAGIDMKHHEPTSLLPRSRGLRVAVALVLGAVVAPQVRGLGSEAVPVALLAEVARGVPVALAAAIPLWAATMAGGVVDALRGAQEGPAAPTVEGRATPLGVLFALAAATVFLSTGGPAAVARALAAAPRDLATPLAGAAYALTSGISLAVAVAAPLAAASIVVEVTFALVARAASPAQVHALLAPIRSVALLAIVALLFDRALVHLVAASPR